ncbi:MFS transporter [Brevibacillus sp. MER 51]|uniref:MFS transporter n=1 Tax=Brevibacillus sp. MER 51 TaxID=2939560 RepID=UPI00203FD28A|nr:MFS transporter [Brevibacillus sp. MER 51]MCM3145410.1 MFS transporter [Brevibacillus sp. MER 51]
MPKKFLILLLALGEFMIGTAESIVTGIIGMIADDTHVSLSLAGQLVTAFSLAFAFGAPVLIALTAGVERKKLILWTLFSFIAANLLASISPSFSLLMVSRILLGLCGGIYTVVALSQAANMASPEKKGSSIAIILMGFSLSLVLGVPLGTMLGDIWGWRPVFALIAVLTLVPFFAILAYLPKQQGEEAVPLRKQLAALRNKRVIHALFISLFFVTGYSTVYTYITPLLQSTSAMTTAWVSTTLFLAGLASVAGSRIGGVSTDKWGILPTLYVSLLLHAVILLMLPLSSQLFMGAIITVMFWVAAVQTTVPAQQYYLITLSPHSSQVALSMNTSVFQLGLALGAGLGGGIVDHVGIAHISWVGGLLVLVGFGFAWASFAQEKRQESLQA